MNATAISPVRINPGRAWRALRIFTTSLAWIALLLTPLLGGWQRTDARGLSAWNAVEGFDLSAPVTRALPPSPAGGSPIEASPLVGGGTGAEYFGIPMVNPVAGLAGLTRTRPTGRGAWALLIPLLIALLFGRVFCGWFCPFGTLARLTRRVLEFLPRPPPHFEFGQRRWLRFVVLGTCLILGAVGSQALVTLALPHLVLTQTFYGLWLLGGGGALLGWLLGLFSAGVFFGPTAYCATLCPTGGVLALLGKFRPVRLRIEHPDECGTACRQCDLACWLQLNPATGDAGMDCDSCGRCARTCPHDNLRIGWRRGEPKKTTSLPIVTGLLLLVASSSAQAADPYVKPRLVLDAHRDVEGANIAVGVLDQSEVRLNADTPTTVGGSELTVRLTRGPRAEKDALGRMGAKEHHQGALKVTVLRDEKTLETVSWEEPNSPRSTVRRKLYRARLDAVVGPGDVVRIETVPGWTSTPVEFWVASPPAGEDLSSFIWFFFAGLLVNAGLLSLALAMGAGTAKQPSP